MSHIPYYGQQATISKIEYNKFTDEYFIVIPDDIAERLHLKAGDTLDWIIDGKRIIITKKLIESDSLND